MMKEWDKFIKPLFYLFFVIILYIFVLPKIIHHKLPYSYIAKNDIYEDIENGIEKNADNNYYYDLIIHNKSDSIFVKINVIIFEKNFFSDDLSIIEIMERYTIDFIKDDSKGDLIKKVKLKKNELDESSIFFTLEKKHKNIFKNLEIKLGKDYHLIKNEMKQIAEELQEDQYSNAINMDFNFWLSFSSLISTVIFGIYQLITDKSKKDEKVQVD